jgi:uncharacterized membrane protein YfcA
LDSIAVILPPLGAALTLAAAALAGGLARGFSGFGAALIFVPLAAAAIGPRAAVPLMLAMEGIAMWALVPGAWRIADRREVALLVAGAAVGTPAGAAVLATADPVALRWGVAGVILALLAVIASGWRLRARPTAPLTLAVGAVSGVLGGVALVSGPPIITYLLGRGAPAARVRAVFNLYLAAGALLAAVAFAAAGLLVPALLGPFLVAAPVYFAAIWAGARMFGLAGEAVFRRVCYAMIALSALVSLPVWDGVLPR